MPLVQVGNSWINTEFVGSISRIVNHSEKGDRRMNQTIVFSNTGAELARVETDINTTPENPNKDEQIDADNRLHRSIVKRIRAALAPVTKGS